MPYKSKFPNKNNFSFNAFLSGLFGGKNKLKQFKKENPEPQFSIPHDENEIDKGFSKFVANMNSYFHDNPDKKEIFKNELDFINTQLGGKPHDEKMYYTILPYPYLLKYDYNKTEVFTDEETGMFYVILGNHKLYYHKGFTNKAVIQKIFTFLSAEQNPHSPHRYLDDEFSVDNQDVVLDLGAAEGNFSLMVADIVKEIIIVESDPIWMEALHKTFEPWKEKVSIINKAIGECNDDKTITLEQIQKKNKITAIKMDIEGAETSVITQAETFFQENNVKMAIAVYHRESDATDIKELLEKNNFKTSFSKGYMLFIYDKLKPPFFRKGLIRAFKSH